MMTEPYQPANATEVVMFVAAFCDRCTKDAYPDSPCPIFGNVLCFTIGDPEYPPEWICDEGDCVGATARCTAFVSNGRAPPPRPPKPAALARAWHRVRSVVWFLRLFLGMVWHRVDSQVPGRIGIRTAFEVAWGIHMEAKP